MPQLFLKVMLIYLLWHFGDIGVHTSILSILKGHGWAKKSTDGHFLNPRVHACSLFCSSTLFMKAYP